MRGELLDLSTREQAAGLWILIGFVFILAKPGLRRSLRAVVAAALQWKVALMACVLTGWVIGVCYAASRVGLWDASLTKDALFWLAGPGVWLLVNMFKAATVRGFLRARIQALIGLAVSFEFMVGEFTLPLLAELVILPVLTAVILVSAVAETNPAHAAVKKLADLILIVASGLLLAHVASELIASWRVLDAFAMLRQFALPIWLTLAVLPFIYLLSLFAGYELVFMRLDHLGRRRTGGWRVKAALALGLHLRTQDVAAFTGGWLPRLAATSSFRAARVVVREYRASRDSRDPASQPSG